MKKDVLFRVDGGKVFGISMGHIKRCLILARALADQYTAVFIMKDYADGVDYVKRQGIVVEPIGVDDDSEATLIGLCETYSPARIIFDLPSNSYSAFFEYARTRKIPTIVFDIVGRCAWGGGRFGYGTCRRNTKPYLGLSARFVNALGPATGTMPDNHGYGLR